MGRELAALLQLSGALFVINNTTLNCRCRSAELGVLRFLKPATQTSNEIAAAKLKA